MDGLHIFGFGIAVVDHAATCLNIEGLILDHGCPQRDAHIHVPPGAEIADTAAIKATLFGFQFVDDFHGPHFWCP